MRLVFIDTTLTTPPLGGATTWIVELCTSLVARGDRVTVVTQPGRELSAAQRLAAGDVEVRSDLWRMVHLPEERAQRLADWINRERADVYVVSISPDCGWLSLPRLNSDIATVSIAHNDVAAFYDPVSHYYPLLDCAVGVSAEIHRKLIANCGVPSERARYVPYGIDAISEADFTRRASARENRNTLRIGYVGRLEQPQKRVLDFVPLARELERRGVLFELHMIGEGNDRVRLEQEFKRKAPNASVRFWGWLSPDEVKDRLAELDVFLLMSDCEGLPVALLEAMGHGLAPVVSDIASGNVQLVRQGENGFVAPVGDIVRFADRIESLAQDNQLLHSMKEQALKSSREYSVEHMVKRYLACFSDLTAADFSRRHRQEAVRPFPIMPSCKSSYPVWARKLKQRFLATINALLGLVTSAVSF